MQYGTQLARINPGAGGGGGEAARRRVGQGALEGEAARPIGLALARCATCSSPPCLRLLTRVASTPPSSCSRRARRHHRCHPAWRSGGAAGAGGGAQGAGSLLSSLSWTPSYCLHQSVCVLAVRMCRASVCPANDGRAPLFPHLDTPSQVPGLHSIQTAVHGQWKRGKARQRLEMQEKSAGQGRKCGRGRTVQGRTLSDSLVPYTSISG